MSLRPALIACAVAAAIAVVVDLRLSAAAPESALPVETLYADATAKESAVRTALGDAPVAQTVLKAVRTVVSDYEAIVRHYPASGYSDDALWKAARLSLDGFTLFGDPSDRDTAVHLLKQLTTQYPSSRFSKQAPDLLASAGTSRTTTSSSPEILAARQAPRPPMPSATPPRVTLKNIQRVVLPDVVRVIIELDGEVPFHDERLDNPKRVFVDLRSTRAVPALTDRTLRFDGDSAPVHQVRLGRQIDGTTRVVLDALGIAAYSVYQLYQPYRLVIDCARSAAGTPDKNVWTIGPLPTQPLNTVWAPALPAGSPGASASISEVLAEVSRPAEEETAESVRPATEAPLPSVAIPPPPRASRPFTVARQLGLGVSRIVIDPGHGGHDPGAQYGGLDEAEAVLDIALRLEQLLLKVPGIDVVLTRRTDEFVPLQERMDIANREGADLFLSIHGNANASPQVHGIETYFLNFASTLSAAAVAARENAASGQAMAALPDLVKAIALNNKVDESRELATIVQRALIEKLRGANKTVKDLGVKQAPFVVLIGAAMPSVLSEISFVTNSQEARLLKTSAYRQRIAEGLFTAVRRYQASLKNVSTVAERPSQ